MPMTTDETHEPMPVSADENDLPPDDWQCTYEKLVTGSPATITDCHERALPDTEPPRCWLHEGKP